MRIQVMPAKRRDGTPKVIFDRVLDRDDLQISGNDEITLSICARGIYEPNSSYRYILTLSRRELASVARLEIEPTPPLEGTLCLGSR